MKYAQGLYINGVMKGYRSSNRTINKRDGSIGQITDHELGVAVSQSDGFGGFSEEIVIVRVPEKMADATFINQVNGMSGKSVAVPVWVSAYSGQRGAGYRLMMDSHRCIDMIKPTVEKVA